MNPIAQRIADFLKDFQPFNSLTDDQLINVAMSVRVFNIEKNKTLFQINDKLHDSFYVVNSGTISLTVISDADETLLNKCYAGDVFGLRPFFAKNNYMMTATARAESIIYAIPIDVFKPLLAQNPEVLDFLLESFASTSNVSKDNSENILSDNIRYSDAQTEIQYFQTLDYSKNPLISKIDDSIQSVAKQMNENHADNVLIIDKKFPIGIVTDRDFRSKIATGIIPITASIGKIMSSPVITVSENLSLAEAQLLMLKYSVSHLCVTDDGSDKSEIKGIISEHDLVVAQTNNPGVLIKEIKRSQTTKDLKNVREKLTTLVQSSITKNIPLSHVSAISGEIVFSIIKRAIELSIIELGTPPTRFAWLSIGSQGRKEQVLFTDQDNILIFDDVVAHKYRETKDYFIKLAKKTIQILEKIGYKPCENEHLASNLVFCKSISDWTKNFSNWIAEPVESKGEICDIFFDFDLVYGEIEFEKKLVDVIFKSQKDNVLMYDFLGNKALKSPLPLNFFKKFNLEEEGKHKGKFDIKTKGIKPLVDIARLLVLGHNIKGINSTYLRFKQLAIVDVQNKEIYKNAAEAFNELSKFSAIEGLKNDNFGQYIDYEELTKSDVEKLKTSLQSMKELEDIIKQKFTLTHFS